MTLNSLSNIGDQTQSWDRDKERGGWRKRSGSWEKNGL